MGEGEIDNGLQIWVFRVRVSSLSLKSREIGPSKVFGARRKDVLRGEVYAWTPDLKSFDKLREVRVLSYLKLHFV